MTLDGLGSLVELDSIVCESPSYLKRLANVAWRFAFARKSDYDCVFVSFFAQPLMPWIRLFWRGPVVLDAFISLYDSLVLDKGMSRAGGVVARVSLWLDRYSMKHADVALVDTLEHEKLFKTLMADRKMPEIRRLWAGADESDFYPLEEGRFDIESGERFEVLFWGGFIPLQGVDIIVRAGALLDPEKYRITIVGTGQTYGACRDLAHKLNASSICFESWKTPAELRDLATRSHLLLGIFGETEKAGRVIPNKAFQALALGKPLLTGESEGIRELLLEGSDVYLCPMGDAKCLAEKIEWIRGNWDEALEVGKRGRITFDANAGRLNTETVLKEAIGLAVPS